MALLSDPTNATSFGVKLNKKTMKSLSKNSNAKGLIHVSKWICLLAASSTLLYLGMGTLWVYPTILLQSVVLTIPIASLSHEL